MSDEGTELITKLLSGDKTATDKLKKLLGVTAVEEELKGLKLRLDGIAAGVTAVEEEVKGLKLRLDGIAAVLEPGTIVALMETVVYVCIEALPAASLPFDQDSRFAERLKWNLSSMCGLLLDKVVGAEGCDEENLWWRAPGAAPEKGNFPRADRQVLVRLAIAGLVDFINWAGADMLLKWSRRKRNRVSHNGLNVKGVCIPSQVVLGAPALSYDDMRTKVEGYMNNITAAAHTKTPHGTVEAAVYAVCAAVDSKGIAVVLDDTAKDNLVKCITGFAPNVTSSVTI